MERLQWTTNHEEADTKMFVLAKHIVNEHQIQHSIINSPGTGRFMVACCQFTSSLITIDKLWLKTGTGDKMRYVAIHETSTSEVQYLHLYQLSTLYLGVIPAAVFPELERRQH